MAYNPYYPAYQPVYQPYQQSYQPMQSVQQPVQPAQPVTQPAIQNGGFISVRSVEEVESWPIAPGNSMTFYVESVPPMIATKTKGFSQLENPVTKYFDLTERQAAPQPSSAAISASAAPAANNPDYATKDDVEEIKRRVDVLQAMAESMTAQPEEPAKRSNRKAAKEGAADE